MRLGQLSRQTKLNTSDIVEYLADQGITIKSGSNAKVNDEYVELVYSGFNLEPPAETSETEVAADVNEPESEGALEQSTETLVETDDVPVISDPHSEISDLYEGLDDDEEFSAEEIVEIKARIEAKKIAKDEADRPENPNLIKAPKVSLQGLKVIGRIDLPEPKVKKELQEEEAVTVEDKVEAPKPVEVVRHKKRNAGRNRQSSHNRKADINPVELQRQRAEKAVRERKKRELRKEKERKRKHYHKVTQEKKKEVIRKEKPLVEATPEVKKPVLKPKKVTRGNFMSRFWRWLDAKNPTNK